MKQKNKKSHSNSPQNHRVGNLTKSGKNPDADTSEKSQGSLSEDEEVRKLILINLETQERLFNKKIKRKMKNILGRIDEKGSLWSLNIDEVNEIKEIIKSEMGEGLVK